MEREEVHGWKRTNGFSVPTVGTRREPWFAPTQCWKTFRCTAPSASRRHWSTYKNWIPRLSLSRTHWRRADNAQMVWLSALFCFMRSVFCIFGAVSAHVKKRCNGAERAKVGETEARFFCAAAVNCFTLYINFFGGKLFEFPYSYTRKAYFEIVYVYHISVK